MAVEFKNTFEGFWADGLRKAVIATWEEYCDFNFIVSQILLSSSYPLLATRISLRVQLDGDSARYSDKIDVSFRR